MKSIKNITFGLFAYPKRFWYRNFRDIPTLFKRIFFTLKHGYTPAAQWDTFSWFIAVMREVLRYYRYERVGTSVVIPYADINENSEAYNKILDEMILLLEEMDDCNPKYFNMDSRKAQEQCTAAKDRFFELFSKYFYSLWD